MSQSIHRATDPQFQDSMSLPPLQLGLSTQTRPYLPSIHDTLGDILTSPQTQTTHPPKQYEYAGTQPPNNITTINEADHEQPWTCVFQDLDEPPCTGQPRCAMKKCFGLNNTTKGPIPRDIWVLYCRKHHNNKLPSKYGAFLTTLQRMENWGRISHFVLSVKPIFRFNKAGAEEEEGPMPVPAWVQKLVGKTLSFDGVREVVDALYKQTGRPMTPRCPDVVFLPVLRK